MTDNLTSRHVSLEQQRARHAQKSVSMVQARDQDDYFGEAKKMPVRIMAAGLGQALAFIAAKAEKKPGLRGLQANLSEWVLGRVPQQKCDVKCPEGTSLLLHHLIHGDASFQRRVTDETLAYLRWLNRFAESVPNPMSGHLEHQPELGGTGESIPGTHRK